MPLDYEAHDEAKLDKAQTQKKQKYIFETALMRNQESGDDRKPQLRSSSVQSRTKAKAFSRGIN